MINLPTLAAFLQLVYDTNQEPPKPVDFVLLSQLKLAHPTVLGSGVSPSGSGRALARLLLRTATQAAGLSAEQLDRVAVKPASDWNTDPLRLAREAAQEFSFPTWMGDNPRVCAPWSKEEDAELLAYKHMPISALCAKHGRASGGICGRLQHLDPQHVSVFEVERLQGEIRNTERELERRRKQRSAELVKLEDALTEKRDRLARLTAIEGE
jgi:hypothetical protein